MPKIHMFLTHREEKGTILLSKKYCDLFAFDVFKYMLGCDQDILSDIRIWFHTARHNEARAGPVPVFLLKPD